MKTFDVTASSVDPYCTTTLTFEADYAGITDEKQTLTIVKDGVSFYINTFDDFSELREIK